MTNLKNHNLVEHKYKEILFEKRPCLDYDGKLAVGNVKGNTIEAILNGKPTMDLRAAMLGRQPLPLFCQQCQAKPVLSKPALGNVSSSLKRNA